MNKSIRVVLACLTLLALRAGAQSTPTLSPSVKTTPFRAVPELPYRVVANFFKFPKGMVAGEAGGVAINSKGHIFPVSYTHLDVYKRQMLWPSEGGAATAGSAEHNSAKPAAVKHVRKPVRNNRKHSFLMSSLDFFDRRFGDGQPPVRTLRRQPERNLNARDCFASGD